MSSPGLDINNWRLDELQRIVDEFKRAETEREINDRILRKSSLNSLDRANGWGALRVTVRWVYE